MTKGASLSKPLKPSQAAARLSILYEDLPKLDRPWTRLDVKTLRAEKPDWLVEARRKCGRIANERAAVERERKEAEAAKVIAFWREKGLVGLDVGTVEYHVLHVEPAMMWAAHALHVKCDIMDMAAWKVWPKSMQAIEDDLFNSDEDEYW